jgi:hypothetical protein
MPVNIRIMCGFQTTKRSKPANPQPCQEKSVMYYDGKLYDGWQTKEEHKMNENLERIVRNVKEGNLTIEEGVFLLERMMTNLKPVKTGNKKEQEADYPVVNCRY